MAFAENPHKIENIVDKSIERFRALYQPVFAQLQRSQVDFGVHTQCPGWGADPDAIPDASRAAVFTQPETTLHRQRLAADLPSMVAEEMRGTSPYPERYTHTTQTVIQERDTLRGAIGSIVGRTSRSQSLKGILTAGLLKSAVYSLQKLAKRNAPKSTK